VSPARDRRPLTIGIDARAAAEEPAGRGRVVRELLRALARRDDPHTYVCLARERWTEPLGKRFRWELIRARDPLWHLRAARAANRTCDVLLSSNSYLTVWFARVPAVPIVYDMVAFEREMRPNRRSALIERLTLGPALRRAAGVLAISQATADALVARFERARGQVTVAPLGVSPALAASEGAAPAGELPPPGFVLAVGTLEPRKNLPRLVAAYASLPVELQAQHPLVVVGELGWDTGDTVAALRSLGDRCRTLGHVPDEALAQLYRHCAVFCYPSLGEGFGLPVLEAMAAGAPVVTSSVSSLPEVGGDAVQYADPGDVASIADALLQVLRSPRHRARLSARGRARAAQFSWERTAALTLAALEKAAR
jgi:alpha-1,3-rhamnosyl/mannosyltransferase